MFNKRCFDVNLLPTYKITLKTIFDYPFGQAQCFDRYVYFELKKLEVLTSDMSKQIMTDIDGFYKNGKYVFISHRRFTLAVQSDSYKYVNAKKMIGVAIVGDGEDPTENLIEEQSLYGGSFAFFKNKEQAISWAETFFIQ